MVRTPQLKPFVAPLLLSTMPGFIRGDRFCAEMLLCERTYNAFIRHGIVEWCDSPNKNGYRCIVPDPQTFPRRAGEEFSVLPFKYIGDTEHDHFCVGEGYARALRSRVVTGNPYYMLQASMSIDNFHRSLASGDIVIYAQQRTVGFKKLMTEENYKGIEVKGTELVEEERAEILEMVYTRKPWLRPKRKACDEEGEEC